MHEGISTEFLWEFIITSFAAILGWFINMVRNMAVRKIDHLEAAHEENARNIAKLERRVTVVEKTYVKREDVREVVDALREELYCDLDKSFTRIHERFDNLFESKTAPPDRRYPSEAPRVQSDTFRD